jgi:hypothetical protein
MKIRVTLTSTTNSSINHCTKATVDHGAGFSYIINPSDEFLSTFKTSSIRREVQFADGDVQIVTQQVISNMTVTSIDGQHSTKPFNVSLGVLKSTEILLPERTSADQFMVIIGRDLIELFPLVCRGASSAFIDSHCVYQWTGFDLVQFITNTSCELVPESEQGTAGNLAQLELPTRSTEVSNLSFDSTVVSKILNNMVGEGWSTVKRCPGISYRFRPIFTTESRDIPAQEIVHELELPPVTDVAPSKNFARAMYNKLPQDLKDKYSKLVAEFVDAGWWRPVEDSVRPICLPGVNVFLIVNEAGKPRLVTDLRIINDALPPASSESPCLWQFIGLFRMFAPPSIVFEDAKSAFYRTRLSNKLILLYTAFGTFTCDRMVFGISCGPGGLNSGLGKVVENAKSSMLPGLVSIFVDDGGLGGSPSNLIYNTKLLLVLMEKVGYEVPLVESKFRCLADDQAEESLKTEMNTHGLHIPMVDSSKILGVNLSYKQGEMIIDCARLDRLIKARKFLDSVPTDRVQFSPTKKQVFGFSGLLSFDPTKLHPCERSCADGWRSLYGAVFSKFTWDEKCPASVMTPSQFSALDMLISWSLELLSDQALETPCAHSTPVQYSQQTEQQLMVSCDASLDGYGFTITCGPEQSTLWEDAQRWKRSERNYHSNRRELIAAKVGIASVLDLVEFRTKSYTVNVPKISVLICSDNLATVSWLTTRTPPKSSRAIEQRSIARLVSAIDDDLNLLSKHAAVKVVHVAGETNLRADYLSRLFSKTCYTENNKSFSLGEVLAEVSPKVIGPAGQEQDKLQLILDDQCSSAYSSKVVEYWCSSSYDMSDVYAQARWYRFVFEVLKQSAKKGEIPEFTYGVTDCDLDLVARMAQHDDHRFHDHKFLPNTGPLLWCQERGLILQRSGTPTGQVLFARFIPKTCTLLRKKLVLTAHRETLHGSPERLVSHIGTFFSPALLRVAKDVCTFCVPCQVERAKRTQNVPPAVSHFDHDFLQKQVPYHTVGVDFLTLGEKRKVLTVTCAFTRHVTWTVTPDETMDSAISALEEVQLLRGGIRHIVVDQAGYFRTPKFAATVEGRLHGATVELLAARAPFEGGFFEKTHDLGLRRIKLLLRELDGHVNDLADQQLQKHLNQVTLVLNTRPLGCYSTGPDGKPVPITPDSLAFGFTRQYGCLSGSEGDVGLLCPFKAVNLIRSAFMEDFWRSLKQRSLNAAQYKCAKTVKIKINKPYAVGDPVLVYRPSTRKLQASFRLGHIAQVVSEHRVKVVYPQGFEQLENTFNVVHLLQYPAESDAQGDAVGRRVKVKFKTRAGHEWYGGLVQVDQSPFWYIKYDDGDEHWIDVHSAEYEVEDQ